VVRLCLEQRGLVAQASGAATSTGLTAFVMLAMVALMVWMLWLLNLPHP
jgi:hypothetical protein